MSHKKSLRCLFGLIFALPLLLSCNALQYSDTPTSPPIPTATSTLIPTEDITEWDILTLGDSRTGLATWPDILAGYIEEDLGVLVHLNNRGIPAEESEHLLERLQGHDQFKYWIKEAEFVTILTMNRSGYSTFVGNDFSKGCPSAEYEIILEDIIEEILALREGNPLILRLIEHYNFPGTTTYAMDYYSDRGACFEQYNHSTHTLADKYNLMVVPVFEAFNDLKGAEIPDEKWYLDDGMHLSPVGDIVIADRIRDLGYEPLIP